MFIGRRQDGTIYGCWTSPQPNDADHSGIEEVKDDHPDLVAFLAPKEKPTLTVEQKLAPLGLTISDLKAELAK